MKRCGLYIRVSTEKQAKIEEGSLKNQDQLLTQHIELKSKISNEKWIIIERYIDEGRSAKNIQGRPQYLRMVKDIERGKIDTVFCTALSRISRSTRDLLDMIDFFKKHNVDFICLKEDFDTTTPQGKCFVTIMGALNEFEREQVSERTKASTLARAERGLYNGGRLLGYDRIPEKRGYLKPNEKEAILVNFAFDTYLKCGSIVKTTQILNENGYRTKEFTGRFGKYHQASPFSVSTMEHLLTNYSYIGKKEINKISKSKDQNNLHPEERYKIVNAVWPAIISEEKFYATQKIIKDNLAHRNNGIKPAKHFYLLNGGFLYCHKCGSLMQGRGGTSQHAKKKYYYYVCSKKECRFKLPQKEIEGAVQLLIKKVVEDETILGKIIEKTNIKLKEEIPKLLEQKRQLEKELEEINSKADYIMDKYMHIQDGQSFVKEKLADLAQRKCNVEDGLESLRIMVEDIEKNSIDKEIARQILNAFNEVFAEHVTPYQKRGLLQYILTRVEFSDNIVRVGVDLDKNGSLLSSRLTDLPSFSTPSTATKNLSLVLRRERHKALIANVSRSFIF